MPSTTKLSDDVIAALGQYDTPTICNAIELFEVRPRTSGYMNHRIQSCFPKMPPMVGYAVTTTWRASKPADSVYEMLVRQVETLANLDGPGVMVFEDVDSPSVAATFGEVMCSTYKAAGAAGIITSGAGRDLEQVEALSFPAFTSSTICSHGYCSVIDRDVPVCIGGIEVKPGDLLHGDANGVTNIPHEIADQIPDVCAKFAEAESFVLEYCKGSSFTCEGYEKAFAELHRHVRTIADSIKIS